jgi:uncharacterized membrane protein
MPSRVLRPTSGARRDDKEEGEAMADLIAIGYQDETTALEAMDEVGRLSRELVIQPDAVAAIVRNKEGKLRVTTEKSGIDQEFQRQVRDMLQPGTSALFLVVEKVTPDKAVEGLSRFGGTVLKSSLSKDAEHELQEALHGQQTTA